MWHHFSSSITWLDCWRYTNNKKVAIRAWEAHSDSGRTSTMYLHGRRVVREVWFPRATNIQAAYVDYVPFLFSLATFFLCEDNKPIDLVILYCVVMPFYPSSTKRHETHSLATDFPLFNLDAGSMPSLLDSIVSLPFLIQPRHGLVCMKYGFL